jgi:hypothetical protein
VAFIVVRFRFLLRVPVTAAAIQHG